MVCQINHIVTFTLPQALKLLRTRQFCPLVVFIKAENAEGVKRLHQNARVDNPSGQSTLSVSWDLICNCAQQIYPERKLFTMWWFSGC